MTPLELSFVLSSPKYTTSVEKFLSESGFKVPEKFQKIVEVEVGGAAYNDVRRYWQEVAKEHIASSGQADSDKRNLPTDAVHYRSGFLDELASRLPADVDQRFPIIDSLGKFEKNRMFDDDFRAEILGEIRSTKRRELNLAVSTQPVNFTRNAEKVSVMRKIAPSFGYTLVDAGVTLARSGIELLLFLDGGGRGSFLRHLQWRAFCCLNKNKANIFPIKWDMICPGFDYYNSFENSEEMLLGITANLKIGELFIERGDAEKGVMG